MSKVYVFLADGFEEVEAFAPVDILRRAGAEVALVSMNQTDEVCGSHKIKAAADVRFEDADFSDADLLVLPGGMPGTKRLGAHEGLAALLKEADNRGTGIAAICAAPSVLGDLGLLAGKKAVCYPGFEEHLTGADVQMCGVVTDGQITTARGMGKAVDFGLELAARLFGAQKKEELKKAIIY